MTSTMRSFKYGPGYSHVLNSFKDMGRDDYEDLFSTKSIHSKSKRKSRKTGEKIASSNRNSVPELLATYKPKLAPLSSGDPMKLDSKL